MHGLLTALGRGFKRRIGWKHLGIAASLLIIRVNLHRKFFMREEKLQQQREAAGIARRVPNKLALIFFADLGQRLPSEGAIGNFAIIARKPCFANFLRKLPIGINR